jgi:hypothetical protein
MVIATGNHPELLWPGIATLWGYNYTRYQPIWSKFMQKKTATKAFEKDQGVTGFPIAGVKPQGESVTYVDTLQGYQKETVMVTYGLGTIITKEMMDDEQYGFINEVPGMLADSLRELEEVVCASLFNNGFGSQTAADGLSYFNSAHVNVGGGTQSNVPAVASDLSQASLEQAFIDLMDFKTERNLRIRVNEQKLLVAPTNRFNAERILKTDKATGSNDNDVNPVRNSVDLIVNPYLTDPDAWFISTDVKNGAIFYKRAAARLTKDNDFDSDNLKFKQTERFGVNTVDWRAWYGTAGA